MRKRLIKRMKNESGMVLAGALIIFALSGLLVAPLLNLLSTDIDTREMLEEDVQGIYAAEAGIKDAMWLLWNNPPESDDLPYSYQIQGLNGMTVGVEIGESEGILGIGLGDSSGVHEDWASLDLSVDFVKDDDTDFGTYTFTLSVTNSGNGNQRVEFILLWLPSRMTYVPFSTGGDLANFEPDVIGYASSGIALLWNIPVPQPVINKGETAIHTFQMRGPEGIDPYKTFGFSTIVRQDVGDVWINHPYKVTAVAENADLTQVVTITAILAVYDTHIELLEWDI